MNNEKNKIIETTRKSEYTSDYSDCKNIAKPSNADEGLAMC